MFIFAYIFLFLIDIRMSSLTNKTDRCMYRQWDYDYDAFGKAIRTARRAKDMIQDEVADLVGCSRATIWKMEHGGYCNPLTMFKVSSLLEVDFMQFNIIPQSEEQRTREDM